MFGAVWGLISAPRSSEEELIETAHALFQAEVNASEMGPDALSRGTPRGVDRASRSNQNRAIKTLLPGQRAIAGVGNVYTPRGSSTRRLTRSRLSSRSLQQLALIAEGVYDAMRFTLESADGEDEVLYGSARGEQVPSRSMAEGSRVCGAAGVKLVNMQISKRATVFCPR